jgi:hypothetical protein
MPRRARGNSFDSRSFGQQPVRKARSFVIKSQPDDGTVCSWIESKSPVEIEDKRRLRESVGAPDRGRKQFDTVVYNPFQEEAYKAQYPRYIKALKLTPSTIVKQDSTTVYAFQSCNSPVGFWTTTKTDTLVEAMFLGGQCEEPYDVTFVIKRIGVGGGGTTLGQTYTDTHTFVANGPLGNPYFGPSSIAPGNETVLFPTGDGLIEVFGNWSNDVYSGFVIEVQSVAIQQADPGTTAAATRQQIATHGFIRPIDKLAIGTHGFRQSLVTTMPVPKVDNCGNTSTPLPVPPIPPGGQCEIFYDITKRECFTGVANGCVESTARVRGPFGGIFFAKDKPSPGFMAWYMQAPNGGSGGVLQLTGAYNYSIYTSLTFQIISIVVSPPPTNPPGTLDNCGSGPYVPPNLFTVSEFDCNCPDKSKKLDPDFRSAFRSRRIPKDWSSSEAGTTRECKHIYAAKMASGVKFVIPKDVPPNISIKERSAAFDPFRGWSR